VVVLRCRPRKKGETRTGLLAGIAKVGAEKPGEMTPCRRCIEISGDNCGSVTFATKTTASAAACGARMAALDYVQLVTRDATRLLGKVETGLHQAAARSGVSSVGDAHVGAVAGDGFQRRGAD
jgi:hypothetical protein